MYQNLENNSSIHSYKHRLLLLGLLFLIICLNLYDIFHSLHLIRDGLAVEGNPIMRYLLERNPATAVIIKMAVAVFFAVIIVIYSLTHAKRALTIAMGVAVLYFLVTVWHLTGPQITNWYMSG